MSLDSWEFAKWCFCWNPPQIAYTKTHVILTPGALLVGWEPHLVFHFRGIRPIRGIRGGVEKPFFDQWKSVLACSPDLESQKILCSFDVFGTPFSFELLKWKLALPPDAKRQKRTLFLNVFRNPKMVKNTAALQKRILITQIFFKDIYRYICIFIYNYINIFM